ncbi:MAG: lysophospholipid acyltransferase family protein [Planctomycetes bacterium]|nr:lysophospholipid acyltransferase family protein [Planctomycetota bacterium]
MPTAIAHTTPPARIAGQFLRILDGSIAGPLARVLGLPEFGRAYRAAARRSPDLSFAHRALTELDVTYGFADGGLDRIPAAGPVVLTANHPSGMLEGLILFDIMARRRSDGRMLSNSLLTLIPELRDAVIAVDPYGGAESRRANLAPLREAVRWVRRGGLLGTFPSGDVARLRLPGVRVGEEPWSPTIARLTQRAGATVVPVHFQCANGPLFHLLGLLHPRLRTAMLLRELLAKRGRTVAVRIGRPITAADLERIAGPAEQAAWLRARTMGLPPAFRAPVGQRPAAAAVPVAGSVHCQTLAAEVAALPLDRTLDASGDLSVVLARAAEAPAVMREIARLREVTFRAIGEGTGRDLDRDRFDEYYWHLFLWDRHERRIAGAYRLGATDEILPRFGTRGLYTTTLFRISRRLLDRLDPALEMGRSFVREEYQRSHQPLALLWRGIGAFVLRQPRYRILFGPVSISARYRTTSTELMREFLKENGHWSDLARFVRPRQSPPPVRSRDLRACSRVVADIDDLSHLVAGIEEDGKGVPVLLRQYLKLGARFLGFNIDPDFGDALDGLIMTDLARTEPRILARYMGREEAAGFLAHHGVAVREERAAGGRSA